MTIDPRDPTKMVLRFGWSKSLANISRIDRNRIIFVCKFCTLRSFQKPVKKKTPIHPRVSKAGVLENEVCQDVRVLWIRRSNASSRQHDNEEMFEETSMAGVTDELTQYAAYVRVNVLFARIRGVLKKKQRTGIFGFFFFSKKTYSSTYASSVVPFPPHFR